MRALRYSPTEVAANLIARARARGARDLLVLGLERLRDNISSHDELALFLVDTATVPQPERDDVTFRAATPADADAYTWDIGTAAPASFVTRLSHTSCFVVTSGDRLVHASWVTTSAAWTREVRAYVKPPPGSAYVYESFTAESARGRGIYPFALARICAVLRERDIAHLWVAVEVDNLPSIRAVAKGGFVERARVAYRRRFGKLTIESKPSDEELPSITANLT